MSFPINTGVPAANNNPSVDQQPMQDNFVSINSWGAIDHVGYGVSTNAGKHLQVSIPTPLSGDPGGVTGTQSILYTKDVSSVAQLFLQNASTVFQITGLVPSSTGATAGAGIKLSNGLIINYAQSVAFTGGAGTTYTFQTTYPYTTFFVVFATLIGTGFTPSNSPALSTTQSTLLSFNGITSSGGSNTVNWIAIGY